MTRFRSLLIFGLMTLAAGGYLAAQEKPCARNVRSSIQAANPHLNNKESIRGGMSLYRRMCGECHALDATGYRGPNLIAYMANGAADEALFQVIRKGVPGTEMPQSNRPDHEILQIIAYLRNIGRRRAAGIDACRQRRERRSSCSPSSVRTAIESPARAAASGPT